MDPKRSLLASGGLIIIIAAMLCMNIFANLLWVKIVAIVISLLACIAMGIYIGLEMRTSRKPEPKTTSRKVKKGDK